MRKFLVLFVFAIGFAFTFQISANAQASSYDKATSIVNKANVKIDSEINKAVNQAASLSHDRQYDQKLDAIIVKLLDSTNRIAEKATAKCEKIGVTVEFYNTPVQLGDQIVYVDPIHIIDW